MTLQTIPGGLWIPKPWVGIQGSNLSYNVETLLASSSKFAVIFRIPKTGSITKLAYYITAAATPSSCDIRLETVDATTGNPSGTLYGTGTNVAQTPAVGWNTATLGTPASVTAGDVVAFVITPTTTIDVRPGTLQYQGAMFPYPDKLLSGTWSKREDRPVFAAEYSGGTYEFIAECYPVSAITQTTYNSGSTPDEYALKFQLPFPARCAGFWFIADLDGDVDVKLYDSDGTTVLATQSFDKDIRQINSIGPFFGRWATAVALVASTNYRLALTPSSVTGLTISRFTYPSSAVMAASEGGTNFLESSRTDAGAWTDTALNRPVCGLLFDQFDDGGGGGLRAYANAG